jgi:hypothetical protein
MVLDFRDNIDIHCTELLHQGKKQSHLEEQWGERRSQDIILDFQGSIDIHHIELLHQGRKLRLPEWQRER